MAQKLTSIDKFGLDPEHLHINPITDILCLDPLKLVTIQDTINPVFVTILTVRKPGGTNKCLYVWVGVCVCRGCDLSDSDAFPLMTSEKFCRKLCILY